MAKKKSARESGIRRSRAAETARRKSQILLAVIIGGVLLLGSALFIVNYVQSRERLNIVYGRNPNPTVPATISSENADLSRFRYLPERIKTGVLYEYIKSNPDGTNPENIAVYVAAKDRLEVFKYREPNTRAGFVIAWMDWDIYSTRKLESYQVFAEGEHRLVAEFEFSRDKGTGATRLFPSNDPPQTVPIPHLPFHIYNFDFTGLNFAFRHLIDPEKTFVIGVPDFIFQNNKWSFVYRGTVTVRYMGEEGLKDIPCRKYSIDGPGLENRGGTIWVNAAEGYIERMQIDLPDNPDWDHFYLDLRQVRNLSSEDWRAFREAHFT